MDQTIIIVAVICFLILGTYRLRSINRRRKAEARERVLMGQSLPWAVSVPSKSANADLMMNAVFISYRKADSIDITERIYDKLVENLGKNAVFKDISSIPIGSDFRQYIEQSLASCKVFLLIMGRDWRGKLDDTLPTRIDNPLDIMRIEIETALKRKIPIVPVLVQDAQIPAGKALPESIREVVNRQAVRVRPDPDFHGDVERIVDFIKRTLGR